VMLLLLVLIQTWSRPTSTQPPSVLNGFHRANSK
jgi:hypothetical protein